MFNSIITAVAAVLMTIGSFFIPSQPVLDSPMAVGGTDTKFVQTQPFFLSGAGVSLGATTIVLKSFTKIDGTTLLTMSDFGTKGYATLEPNNSVKEEAITFTGVIQNANGTATLTGVKNQDTIYPYTESTGTAKAHAGSTKLVITNTAGFYAQMSVWDNDGTISGDWTFASTSIPVYDGHPTFTVGTQLVDKTYADGLAIAGVATSSETNFGGVWLATALQQASSTDGSPNAPYVLQSKNATSTYNSATAPLKVVVTDNSGKIDGNFIDTTDSYNYATTSIKIGAGGYGGLVPVGSLMAYATTTPPAGWLLCDGATASTTAYPDLFAVIGYSYGGSGLNFNVPNLKGRNIIGYGSATTTIDTMGETGGEDTHVQSLLELAAHTHTYSQSNNAANTAGNAGIQNPTTVSGTQASNSTGSSAAMNLLDPYIVLNYIIKY